MPIHVPHPVTEPVSKIGDDFVRGVAVFTGVAAVLEEGKIRLGATQDVIACVLYRYAEGSGATLGVIVR
jgi:fructose-1,6-bisphosphatase/inositol monophosphatase family enzyme